MTPEHHAQIKNKLLALLNAVSSKVANGAEFEAAWDRVMGEGAYEKFVSDFWEAANQ